VTNRLSYGAAHQKISTLQYKTPSTEESLAMMYGIKKCREPQEKHLKRIFMKAFN
jgi:hypothetical protein